MAADRVVDLQLDEESVQLLATTTEAILLGVVFRSSGKVSLFEAGPVTDLPRKRFAGHRDLLHLSLVRLDEAIGFSVYLLAGEVQSFYRISHLEPRVQGFRDASRRCVYGDPATFGRFVSGS